MNWLRQRREELGLTQEELTAQMEVEGAPISRSSLSTWETGKFSPPLKDKQFRTAFARVLKLSVTDLVRRSGYDVAETHSSAAERAAYIVDQLDEETKEVVVRMLEALL